MSDSETARAATVTVEPATGEPRIDVRRRRRRARPRRKASNRRLIRSVYFALASVWGFLSGSAAILAGQVLVGRPVRAEPALAVALVVATLVALVGGFVVSRAYRQAARRYR